MEDKIKIINNFKEKYMNNLITYGEYNDSLYQITDFDKWNKLLIERSNVIRIMFKQNEELIKSLDEVLSSEIDDDVANALFDAVRSFKNKEIHDASILIRIINKLIDFYEPRKNYDKLLYLYNLGALEEMEFFIRMDNDTIDVNPLIKYQKILDLKCKYHEIKNTVARRSIFIAYYNLLGPLADLNSNVRNNIIKYYKEAVEFYNSDMVQSIDKDNPEIIDEMHLLNDVFITSFTYFLNSDLDSKKEYFEIIDSLLDTEEIDDEQRELIVLSSSYAKGKYSNEEMVEKLMYYFKLYLGKGITYDGTEDNINRFCTLSDIAGSIFEILKNMQMDNKKYKYVSRLAYTLLDYIKTVPYKDYTSYFDDISADIYRTLLPFCTTLSTKISLLNILILRRQPMTYIHSIMVSKISVTIAKKLLAYDRSIFKQLIDLGYDTDEKIISYLADAALYHDIGKCLTVGVINLQNRRLTNEEFKYIKMHPSKSLLLIGGDESFKEYYDVMLGHHKTYDGLGGYPSDFDNLNSKYKIAIDLISIADSIDAATDILGRNYTTGKNFYTLLDELIQGKGTRYNPIIVDYIESDEELKNELNALTGEDRASVYYDVFKEIIKK